MLTYTFNKQLVRFIVIQFSLLLLYIFGSNLIGYNHLYAAQSVNYPNNGTIEVTNDFPAPPSINPSPQQGGDGVRAIPTKDRVYAIYHHSDHNNSDINTPSKWDNLDASCIEKSSGSVCPGFPKAIMLNGKHIITEDGSSFGTVDYHNLDAPKVYFGAANDSSSGIACLDLATGNECGYTITDNAAPPAYPSLGGDILHKPNIQTLPYDNENDFDNFNGTIYYFYDAGGVSRVGCQVVNNSYGGVCNVPSVNYSNLFGERLVSSYGSKAYVLSGVYNNGTNSRIVCYDKATNSDCGSGSSGWDTGTITQFTNVVPIPFPDLNKVCIGITGQTYVDPNKFSCVDLTSGAYVVNSTGNPNADAILNQIFKQGDTSNIWFPSYIKGKLYLSNVSDLPQDSTDYLDKDMYCWNFTTSSECSEFSGGVDWSPFMISPGITEDYSYAGDRYTNYRCGWALGDEGFPIPFRLDGQLGTGGCLSTTTNITVDLNDYLCEPERGIIKSISLEGVDLSLVDTGVAILTDQNGNPIPVSGGSNEVDLKAAGGQVDISSLNLKYVKIQGQLILNTLNQWDSANPPKLKVVVEPNLPSNNLISSNCPVDLTADKTSNFSQVASTAGVGTEFEYTITFANNGPNDAYNAKVTDTLPAGNIVELSGANPFSYTTEPVSTTIACAPAASSTTFTCDINKLISTSKNSNAKAEVKLKVRLTQAYLDHYVSSGAYKSAKDFSLQGALDPMTNTVSIAPGNHPKTNQPQTDTNLDNNQDTVTDTPEAADIELIKLVSPIDASGNPILTSNSGPGWETPYQKYVTSTGQVYVSQDLTPSAEGWNVSKLDYMVFVVNRGPNQQKAVTVQDTRTISSGNLPNIDTSYGVKDYSLASNPAYATATLGNTLNVSAGDAVINWTLGDMNPGDAKALFYRTDYSDNTGDYHNFAQNTTPGNNRDPDSESGNCTPENALTHEDDCDNVYISKDKASLSIAKSVSPSEVTGTNQDVTYTIIVTNTGSIDYQSADYSVNDTLPEGLDYISSTPTGKCTYDNQTRKIVCADLGGLPAGDTAAGILAGSVTIKINAKTNASVLGLTKLNNIACVKPTIPSVGLQQDGQVCDDVEIPQNSVDLELSKTIIGSTGVYPGDNLQYKISLTNKGPATAKNVVVKETYPPAIQFISAAPESGSYNTTTHEWTVLSLGSGQTVNLVINAKALDYKEGDNTKNLAEVTECKQGSASPQSNCSDPDSSTNNCQNGANKEDDCAEAEFHEPVHDIKLEKAISNQKESYSVGDTVEYLITATNNGPDTAKHMIFKDTLPSELEYLYSESPESTVYNSATHEWYVRSLSSGQSVQLRVVVRIKRFVSTLTNIVEWTGCKDESGKEIKCGKDPDSTPNNCQNGANKEDDCDQKQIKLSAGKGLGVPVTGALVGKIIAGSTGLALAAYLGRDMYLRARKKAGSERL